MSATDDKASVAVTPKHYRQCVKGIALGLLLVLYMVVPVPIRLMGGSAGFDVVFRWTFGWISLLLWIGVCLLWWRIVDVQAKWIAPNKAVWSVLVLLPVILIGGRAVYRSWPSVRAARVLYNADLAPLPPSATEIKVYLWFTPIIPMSGEGYLRFRATPDDIEHFLTTSPILRDVEYANDSENQITLFYPRDDRRRLSPEDIRYRISRDLKRAPAWFIKELTGSMMGYYIDPSGSQISGAVIVDEASNLVFVRLSFG